MSDEKKKMIEPVARPTARDALVYAAGLEHGHCTVIARAPVDRSRVIVTFKCACNTRYTVAANDYVVQALRNVPEDKTL